MKRTLPVLLVAFVVGLTSMDADARRFGGGKSFGKQRPAPTMREAPKQQSAATPAQPAQAAPAGAAGASGAAAAARPAGFMGRWGGLLAGLGIGVLLTSLFGAQLGPIVGLLLLGLLIAGLAFLAIRFFGSRNAPAARPGEPRAQFAGIGSAVPGGSRPANESFPGGALTPAAQGEVAVPADFDQAAFERVAKTSFLRLQAANDARDLDDMRDFTTPEMYAEIAMQAQERGEAPQRTEVVSLEARVIEVVREDGFEIASVRFWGLVREGDAPSPEPFDETWHVQKKLGDRRASWLIAGIQQND